MRRIVGILASVCVVAGALAVAPARVAAAATDNIPGVPLPAAVVSGQLGGPIYDVVYSVDVPASRVLVLSLTGTAGTDFDLYLFDSSASTVYSTAGQVASSTGPTSTESITYAVLAGGRYYIDMNGATNVEGTYQLTTRIATDTTPPNVGLTLDGGAPATSNPTVSASVVATDDLSGVQDMQFATDGVTWQAWQVYTPTVTWAFPAGDGTKTLWVRVRDRAGNVSGAARAAIVLDTTPPQVIARWPDPANPITDLQPTVTVSFSEPISVASWSNVGLIMQDPSGTVVYGQYGWEQASRTGTFTPASPLIPGAIYRVTLGSVVDLAGNPVVPIGSWQIRPLYLPSVTLIAHTRLAAMDGVVAMSGRATGWPPLPVTIERSVGGGPWESVGTVVPATDGTFASEQRITANTSYRAALPATVISASATSAPVRVLVRRVITLAGMDPAVTQRVAAYTRIAVSAVLTPLQPDSAVTLSIYRYVAGRGYVLQTSVTRATAMGRYTFSWHPGRGSYYVRLTTPPTPMYANGVSAAYRWIVS